MAMRQNPDQRTGIFTIMARGQNAERVIKAPSVWFPWNYRQTLMATSRG